MNKFKPIMISFNEDAYINAKKTAQKKLEQLDKASVYIHKQLGKDIKVNMKKLAVNMIEHFKDLVLERFKDVNQLGLSAGKLIEAKEFNLTELQKIQSEFDNMVGDIEVKSNTAFIKVDRKDFETWTTNEKQNKKLLAGNKLISALNDFNKENNLYHNFIAQGTGGYIKYDMYKNHYYVSNEVIFS